MWDWGPVRLRALDSLLPRWLRPNEAGTVVPQIGTRRQRSRSGACELRELRGVFWSRENHPQLIADAPDMFIALLGVKRLCWPGTKTKT